MFVSRYTIVIGLSALFIAACEEGPMTQQQREFEPLPPMETILPPESECDEQIDWIDGVVPRRLSSTEYKNSVADLFGLGVDDFVNFPPDEETLGFDNNARALQASPIHIERYFESAEGIATRLVGTIVPELECDLAGIDPGCLAGWISDIGLRVWRRPLTDDENDRMVSIFETALTDDETEQFALGRILEALLQSPHFLYRIEIGQPTSKSGIYQLDQYEIATRLSFMVWRTGPDAALLEAAENGELATPQGRLAQVDRMLDDPRAESAWWSFFEQWLHLDELRHIEKEEALHPDFTVERNQLYGMARLFVQQNAFAEGGSIERLLNQDFALENEPSHARRRGILSTPAWLAVNAKPNMTSPIHRGVFVREQLLCTALPPPPPEAMVTAPDPDPTLSAREQYEIHRAQEACASCHQLIDPVGLVFEHFDEVGDWRDRDNGKRIDSSGEVFGSRDLDGAYADHLELAEGLSKSEQVHRCFNAQVFRFVLGRGERDSDSCWLQQSYDVYRDNGTSLRTLIRHYAQEEAFVRVKREVPDGS